MPQISCRIKNRDDLVKDLFSPCIAVRINIVHCFLGFRGDVLISQGSTTASKGPQGVARHSVSAFLLAAGLALVHLERLVQNLWQMVQDSRLAHNESNPSLLSSGVEPGGRVSAEANDWQMFSRGISLQ